jgi:predicted phosphodiesterase
VSVRALSRWLSWNRKGAVIPAGNMRECRPADSQRKNRTGSALCGPVPANPGWGAVIPRLCIGILLFYREVIIKDFTTIVFICDLQYPYIDKKVIHLIKDKFLPDIKPDYLVWGGDALDFYGLSAFSKDPRRALDTQEDIDGLHEVLVDTRDKLQDTEMIFLEGNHEFRMTKYKWTQCKEMTYIRALGLENLLGLVDLEMKWIPYTKYWQYKKIYFVHGDVISKHSGYTAKQMLDKWGCNIVFGHSHRTGKHNHTTMNGNQGAWESGCLCDLNPEYIKGKANWQHGMSVVEYYKNKIFYVHNIDITNYSFLYNGKYYTL